MCQHSIRVEWFTGFTAGITVKYSTCAKQNAFVPLSDDVLLAGLSWPCSVPRIKFLKESGLYWVKITGGIKNAERLRSHAAADWWVDSRGRGERLTPYNLLCEWKPDSFSSKSPPTALMWAGYRRAHFTCYCCTNGALIGAGQDYNNHFHSPPHFFSWVSQN